MKMTKKKWLVCSVLGFLILLIVLYALKPDKYASVYLGDKKLSSQAIIEKKRVLLPVREFYELGDYSVHFDKKENTVRIQKGKATITLPLDKGYAYINGIKKDLDVPASIHKGKAYIPVRFVNEAMGYDVDWIQKEEKVVISYNPYAFDVIVIGSDPEGIAAAIASAREGQKTLLIDSRSKIGGLFTIGKLNSIDMNMHEGNLITRGLFEEFYRNIGKRSAFDIEEAQNVFDTMVSETPNLTLVLEAKEIKPILKDGSIEGIDVRENDKKVHYTGKQFIDSTQNGDIAYAVGEDFTFGQEDYRQTKESMSVTLIFELSGVNYDRVFEYLNYEDELEGTGADKAHAWGYMEMFDYQSTQNDVNVRGLNIGLQKNGNVLINALRMVGVDGTNSEELAVAKQKAIQELPHIVAFMRENLVGFENADLAGYAEELYIRETRHLIGQYRLNINDVLENRDFPDKIAFGNYPVDIQRSETQQGLTIGNPQQYSIPFRAIVPKKVDNLLVASKASSYDSLAHGSARVVPIGMTVGQAAGVAAAYANENKVDFITMSQQPKYKHVKKIQKRLNNQGAHLKAIPKYKNPAVEHWAYDGLKFLREHALISGSYNNDYRLEKKSTISEFHFLTKEAIIRTQSDDVFTFPFKKTQGTLTKAHIIEFLKVNKITLNTDSMKKINALENEEALTNAITFMFIYELLND